MNLISPEYITKRKFKLILKKGTLYPKPYRRKSYIILRRISRPANLTSKFIDKTINIESFI